MQRKLVFLPTVSCAPKAGVPLSTGNILPRLQARSPGLQLAALFEGGAQAGRSRSQGVGHERLHPAPALAALSYFLVF